MISIMMFCIGPLCLAVYIFVKSQSLLQFYGADRIDLSRRFQYVFRFLLSALMAVPCIGTYNDFAIIIYYFVAFFLVTDAFAAVVRMFMENRSKKTPYGVCRKIYRSGLLAVLVTASVFVYGKWNMSHIIETGYSIQTDKLTNDYKIVQLTDIHYGTVQNPNVLQETIKEIENQKADMLLLGGDIVEEGTSKEQMEEIFQMLGNISTTEGIFYVYGNHDRQPYTEQRSFSDAELEDAIQRNGITILEDRSIEIQNEIVLVGRADAGHGSHIENRTASAELLQGVDRSKFVVVLDHQPLEVEENTANGADLELSGHTHGGQIWPTGNLVEIAGGYNYGEYHKEDTEVIVSSGIAGWRYTLRTGKHCEYVTINVRSRNQ